MKIDKKQLKVICVNELSMDEISANSYLSTYPDEINTSLDDIMGQWLVDRSVNKREIVPGLTASDVINNLANGNFLTAIMYINKLLTSNTTPEETKKQVESLKRPFINWDVKL